MMRQSLTLNMQVFHLSLFTGTIACDHYARECKFGILKKKTKQNKKMRTPPPFSRRSFQFEQLLIGYQSKFNNLLSISSLASISLSFSIYCQTLSGFYTKLNVWGSLGLNFDYDGGPIIENGGPIFLYKRRNFGR